MCPLMYNSRYYSHKSIFFSNQISEKLVKIYFYSIMKSGAYSKIWLYSDLAVAYTKFSHICIHQIMIIGKTLNGIFKNFFFFFSFF